MRKGKNMKMDDGITVKFPSVKISYFIRFWRSFIIWMNAPSNSNSNGPGSKIPDEKLSLLRSIDSRLKNMERCMKTAGLSQDVYLSNQ